LEKNKLKISWVEKNKSRQGKLTEGGWMVLDKGRKANNLLIKAKSSGR